MNPTVRFLDQHHDPFWFTSGSHESRTINARAGSEVFLINLIC
jgi:hypothetical protein